jgi:hypothetical protein
MANVQLPWLSTKPADTPISLSTWKQLEIGNLGPQLLLHLTTKGLLAGFTELDTTSGHAVVRLWLVGILGADGEDLPLVPEQTPGSDAYRSLSHLSASLIVTQSAFPPRLSGCA